VIQHGDGARGNDLDADDGAHQGGLAAPGGPQQTDDLSSGDRERDVVEYTPATTIDPKARDFNRIARTRTGRFGSTPR
jgi:hypothetical protein